jgi:hypothetical protein
MEKQIKQQKLQQQRQQEAQKKQTQKQTTGTNTTYQQGRQPQQNTYQQGRQPQQNTRKQEDESWKQSYMPKHQPTTPSFDKCKRCEETLEDCKTKIRSKTSYAYFDMAKVIRENNHSKERHQKIVDEMLTMITESLARTLNPGI